MKITKELSGYLDLMRFVAAFAVLLGHMDQDHLYMAWLPLSWFSHEAVIVFFVMSGFIIFTTTASRHTDARDYVIARSSRIYSVALPAIAFSVMMTLFVPNGIEFESNVLNNYRPVAWQDLISSLLFLNKSWNNPADLTLNNAYWSLCYEVWYYVIFGLFFFVDRNKRWLWVIFAAICAGPAVLVLFPIWLGGAWLASSKQSQRVFSQPMAWFIFLGSLALIAIINRSGIDITLRSWLYLNVPGFWRLETSQRLFTDYIIGMAIIANIAAFPSLAPRFSSFFTRHGKIFAYLAGFSFTLYLFHRPMTQLIGYYFPNTDLSISYSLIVMFGISLSCLAISYLTERQLKHWRSLFAWFLRYRPPVFKDNK
jgi:peptidoglycan/LPS O-acetylase OafA/YrhL